MSKQILFLIKIPTKQEFTTAVMSHRGLEVSLNLINSAAIGIFGSWVLQAYQEDDQDLQETIQEQDTLSPKPLIQSQASAATREL